MVNVKVLGIFYKAVGHLKLIARAEDVIVMNYLLPRHVCISVAIPLIKNMVLMSSPVTTGSLTHIAGAKSSGTDNTPPNIAR